MFRQGIDQEERNKCISYLHEEMKLAAFREIEQRLFDEIFIQYHGGQVNMPREKLHNAIKRVVAAVNEIIKRRSRITSVPDIASSMFHAYQKRYEDYLNLKEKQADSITQFSPKTGQANLLEESMIAEKKSRDIALKEEKKLWRQLKLSDSEIMKMWNDALAAVKAENWQP